MYKNVKKVIISMCIWTAVTIVFVIPAVVFWGISFDNSVYDDLPDPLMYRIVYLFLAIVCTAPFIMFWIKFVQFMLINRINDLLSADADGFVPISDLARAMGLSEAKMIKNPIMPSAKATSSIAITA